MKDTFTCSNSIIRRFESLGTFNEIQIFEQAEIALAHAEKRVREIDDRMSAFKQDSDISKLNTSAGYKTVEVHPDTLQLLALSKAIFADSCKLFDITIRPLTALWAIENNGGQIPAAREITRAKKLVNSKNLVCDIKHNRAFLKHKGQAVDLGGIAKGYAADEVKRILLENGVESALINLGGNIAAIGTRPDGQLWNIGIQNPAAPRGIYLGTLSISDCSVVTSGSNERFFIQNGKRFHHLLNPRTGHPAQSGLLSVTVVCKQSVVADALSTALFVGGIQSLPLLRKYDAEAIFATEQGHLFVTQGLAKQFTTLPNKEKQEGYRHA